MDFEALKEDCFRHAYGELWEEALTWLQAVDKTYLEYIHSLKIIFDSVSEYDQ